MSRSLPGCGAFSVYERKLIRQGICLTDIYMGDPRIMSWFSKKKAADGTEIICHDNFQRKIGVPDKPVAEFRRRRELIYERLFGKAITVSHELIPQIPHIDVYTFQRSQAGKTVYSLVTGGMSDLAMTLPSRASADAPRRVELVFYCAEPKQEYIQTLRWVADFPHDSKFFLVYGQTIMGVLQRHFGEALNWTRSSFLPPIVTEDQTLASELQLDGDPVHFLWVLPVTTAECNFKLKKGFAAMMTPFQEHRHPHVFDPHRKSYV